MLRKDIEQFIATLQPDRMARYQEYWESITPKNHRDYFNRWIFAYLSVHTTWKKNVESYVLLTKNTWAEDKTQLSDLIKQSGAGLHNMRTKGIWQFTQDFWTNPQEWYRKEGESWIGFRDRCMAKAFGLGLAKTAFALEISYPKDCGVVCVDTHIIQLYGQKPAKLTDRKYRLIEAHWMRSCKKYKVPSPIARHVYWDIKQGKDDTKYWSYVFENDNRNENTLNETRIGGGPPHTNPDLGRIYTGTCEPQHVTA